MPLSLYEEFFRITATLNERGVPYAVIGGMAVSLHTTPRFTRDIDVLLCAKDLESLCAAMAVVGYSQWADPWTFLSTNITLHRFLKFSGEDMLMVDVMVGNEPRYDAMVDRAIVRETPSGSVRLACKEDIITLKLGRNSDIDRTDIKALQNEIRATDDPRSKRPVGLRPPDGVAGQNSAVSGSPPRHRKLAQKSREAPRPKRRRPAK
jgi:hypothetical protein